MTHKPCPTYDDFEEMRRSKLYKMFDEITSTCVEGSCSDSKAQKLIDQYYSMRGKMTHQQYHDAGLVLESYLANNMDGWGNPIFDEFMKRSE